MKKRNKQNELVDKNGLRIGDHIPGSKYVRSFCKGCGEPIRVATKNVIDPTCERCCRPYPKTYRPASGEPFTKGLSHLVDYDGDTYDNDR